ncbi:MAG: DUF4140 domain-containing protein, partial [Planctomycetales bacterium]
MFNAWNVFRLSSLAAATAILLVPAASAAEPKTVTGEVEQVTLYRGQAMVTRTIPLDKKAKGNVELIVGGLPQHIVADSLFAEGDEDVEIRAVRFRTRAVGEAPREEVRMLEVAIEDLTEKVELNQKMQELLEKRTNYLDNLEGFVAPTAKVELSKGVLNAESLEKITAFSFEQRKAVATESVALLKESKMLQKEIALLQRKRSELTGGSSRTVNEAVLFLEKRNDAVETVRLNYLVNNCGWSPSYAFR